MFTDPDDWYLDLQLMTDLLVSGGAPSGCRRGRSKSRRMLGCCSAVNLCPHYLQPCPGS